MQNEEGVAMEKFYFQSDFDGFFNRFLMQNTTKVSPCIMCSIYWFLYKRFIRVKSCDFAGDIFILSSNFDSFYESDSSHLAIVISAGDFDPLTCISVYLRME